MDRFINKRTELLKKIYTKVGNESDFISLALEIFEFQNEFNPIYRQLVDLFNCDHKKVKTLESIPFLPIALFKNNVIKTGDWKASQEFRSSTTSGQKPSIHQIREIGNYEKNIEFCFESTFDQLKELKWFGLLPNYLEQGHSSLIYMVNHFMKRHPGAEGGFYFNEYEQLIQDLKNDKSGKTLVLIGVSYALLDLAEGFSPDLKDVLVIETGGMKGRGREMPREELQTVLMEGFNVEQTASEYGMAELMSQAYSRSDGIFTSAPTMRIMISDLNDPFQFYGDFKQGRINIIDLANIDTCSFLSTDDLGITHNDHQFKISGRTDASELRGCNLLYTK